LNSIFSIADIKRFNLFFLLCITASGYIFPQSIKDSLNFSYSSYLTDYFKTTLEKRLNTYDLRSNFNYSLNYDKFFFGIEEKYFSSLVSSTQKNIKDEQDLSILGEYKYSPFLKFGILTQNSIYSNDRRIAINDASNLYSTFYTKILPIDQLTLVPYAGYSVNRQVGESDEGAIYGGNIRLDRFQANEFQISSTVKYQNENIAPRKNTFQLASFRVENYFSPTLINTISGNYLNTRKDFYFDTDSLTSELFNITKNIQSRTERRYFIEERLYNSRFSSDLFFDLSARVSIRDIDRNTRYKNLTNLTLSSFDTKIEEFRLDFSGTTEYRSNVFFGKIKIDYSERQEKHNAKNLEGANQILFHQRSQLEKRNNNTSEYTTLSLVGNYFLSNKDNISFSVLHRKLVYNTPSEDNFDDRDEILSIIRLSYLRRFNHLFNFFLNIEGSYNHIVYIFGERSSNNNVRRVLKLNSGGEFDGSHFFSRNMIEISANYTTYDYEDINPNTRSFSFRQFIAKDSTSFGLIGKVDLDFLGYVKLSEQGDFNWDNFSNNPERFLAEYYLEPMLSIKEGYFKMGVGLRIFSLKTFGYNDNNVKYLTDEYTSRGPITNFSLQLTNLTLHLNGWYEFIKNEDNSRRELANLNLSVNWKL
jgi:hypothetical protein